MTIIQDLRKKLGMNASELAQHDTLDIKEKRGTFVGLRMEPQSAVRMGEILDTSGLKDYLNPADYHLTLFYSKNKEIEGFIPDIDTSYNIKITDVKLLGSALVFVFESKELLQRHEDIKAIYKAEHSFPELLPHISVKYNPVEGDLEILKSAFAGTFFRVENEYSEIATPMV